ncbi:MAG: hypothetical protein J6Z22_03070 [Lachnospiraceae bacterium]|nr:hypothetical protein [Lachnospiraceae bacterium]
MQAMLSREGLRREMSQQINPEFAEDVDTQEEAQETTEEDEEESPFKLTLEPEQPEELSALKAPWES